LVLRRFLGAMTQVGVAGIGEGDMSRSIARIEAPIGDSPEIGAFPPPYFGIPGKYLRNPACPMNPDPAFTPRHRARQPRQATYSTAAS
jgi:hypothetical protein